MKKALLVDVDSKIPNLALMKLSYYLKNKDCDVELKRLSYSYYPTRKRKITFIDGSNYDLIYISTIFTTNDNLVRIKGNLSVYHGGSGHNLSSKLPNGIEESPCDYSIYPGNDWTYGYITRGCAKSCYFCFVPKKEGELKKANDIEFILGTSPHRKVRFLDNNILAYKSCTVELEKLVSLKIKCQFYQGLDIDFITSEKAWLLSNLNYYNEYVFAFDRIEQKGYIDKKLAILKKFIERDWKLKFFIYCHPEMSIKNDLLYRIEWCKDNKIIPYVMRDLLCWNSKLRNFYIDIASYCNQNNLIKNMGFLEFINKRNIKEDRRRRTLDLVGNSNIL